MGSYLTYLGVGVALVLIDGQLIRRSCRLYLEELYQDSRVADSINRLITVLFHLTVLGVFALLSTVRISFGNEIETIVARTGISLLLLALAHGLTIWILTKVRARRREQRLRDEMAARTDERLYHNGTA